VAVHKKHKQPSKEEAINLTEKTVKTVLKQGANEAEAYFTMNDQTFVGIRNGQITRNMKNLEQGLAIRIIYRKALGFAFTNILQNNHIEETIKRALKIAKINKPDKNWPGFTTKRRFPQPKATFDKRLVKFPSEKLVELASAMLEATINHDKRVIAVQGRVGVTYEATAIANSNGIESFDQTTLIGCGIATIAKEKTEVTPLCFDFKAERTDKIDPTHVGKEAARQAVESLKPRKTRSGTYPIIFTAPAFQDLLHSTFIEALKADRIQREQSALKEKIGEKIASEKVTIHDNGLLPGGLQTSKFDGEGTPKQKTPIIEKGILKNFLYDRYTAKKDNTQSTGNACRKMYMATPTISPTNFVLQEGNKSTDQLINEIDEGLLVYYVQGGQSSNPLTGEFSVVATPAWKIEKGEVSHPVRETMLAGTIFDVLNNILETANNQRKLEYLVAPWIRVENVKAIGKQ